MYIKFEVSNPSETVNLFNSLLLLKGYSFSTVSFDNLLYTKQKHCMCLRLIVNHKSFTIHLFRRIFTVEEEEEYSVWCIYTSKKLKVKRLLFGL